MNNLTLQNTSYSLEEHPFRNVGREHSVAFHSLTAPASDHVQNVGRMGRSVLTGESGNG